MLFLALSGCDQKNAIIPDPNAGRPDPTEEWCQDYGTTEAEQIYSMCKTDDGGYLLVGYSRANNEVNNNKDILAIRTDYQGIDLWHAYLGGSEDDQATCVIPSSSSFLLVGYTNSYGSVISKIYLGLVSEMDGQGYETWRQTYGGSTDDSAFAIIERAAGELIIGSNLGSEVANLRLVDISQVEYWSKNYPDCRLSALIRTDDQGILIVGTTGLTGGNSQVRLIKTDDDGEVIWSETYGGEGEDRSHSGAITEDGGFIITGVTSSYSTPEDPTDMDAYLLKVDASGDLEWETHFGGYSWEAGNAVIQTRDGGYAIVGNTRSFSENFDLNGYIVKTNSSGEEEWWRSIGGCQIDEFTAVIQTSGGGFIVAGSTTSEGSGDWDAQLRFLFAQPPQAEEE